ncbi:MAG: YfhO family protein [Acidobacteria bacterium]|nr:YfhO family protein [Acidobacteriota bacterium]
MSRPPAPAEPAGRGRVWAAAPALLLVGIAALLYRAPLAGAGVLYYRDLLQNYRPLLAAVKTTLDGGGAPWWNPWLGLGQPLLANPNHLVLHPATALLLLLPPDAALTLAVFLPTCLGILGAYLLAREAGASRPGAFTAGGAYGFSGPFLSLGNLPNLLAGAAWLPLALFLLLRFWRRPTAGRATAAALGAGFLWIAAEPAALFAFFLIGAALALGEGPGRIGRAQAGRLGDLAAVGSLGFLVAAVQWLPFLELLGRSRRGSGFPYAVAAKWSVHPLNLAEAVLPRLFGDPTRLDPEHYWGTGFFETGFPLLFSLYLGTLVLLLAAVRLASRPARADLALAAVVGVSVLFALGAHGPVHGVFFRWLPGFDGIRYPVRFLLAAPLGLGILAGRGLDAALGPVDGGAGPRCPAILLRRGGLLLMAAGLAAVAAGVPGYAARVLAAGFGPGPQPQVLFPLEAAVRTGVLRVAGLGAVAFLVLFLHDRARLGAAAAAWALAGLSVLDPAAGNAATVAVERSDFYREDPILVDFLRARGGSHRVEREERPPGVRVRMPDPAVSWGFAWDRATLSRATPAEFGIRMGFGEATDHLDLDRPARLRRRAAAAGPESELRLLCRSGIRFLLSYRDLSGEEGVRAVAGLGARSDPPVRLWELPCALPHAFAVGAARFVPGPDPAMDAILAADFDPRGEVILEAPAGGTRTGSPGPLPARIAVDAPGHVEIEVRSDRAGYAVLLENQYPGWRVRVDGEWRQPEPANGLFLAVPISAGRHRVRFEYRPRTAGPGAALSLLGLVAAGWGLPRLRASRPRTVAAGRAGVPDPAGAA